MTTAAVVPFAALALLGLAAADERLPRVYAVVKPLATASLFFLLFPELGGSLGAGIGLGLVLATLGDALLVHKANRRSFYAGMACFAGAHLAYTAALLFAAGGAAMTAALTGLVVTSTLSLVLEAKLLPRLARELRVPVGVYGVILTGTVAGAVAWYATGAPPESRRLVLAGALLLYLGDAFYAYHRFVSRVRYGQSFGLLLYWAGQLALVLGVRGA